MSMYENFKTDEDLERKGVEVDYGDFRVTLARAGGANAKYQKVMEALSKPYRRAIQTETLSNEVALDLVRTAYARAIVLRWETVVGRENGERQWEIGIEAPPESGEKLLPFTTENVITTFERLPEIFNSIQRDAGNWALYRQAVLEEDAGN